MEDIMWGREQQLITEKINPIGGIPCTNLSLWCLKYTQFAL